MDLSEAREVEKIVHEYLSKSLRQYKDCPKCGQEMTMLKYQVEVWRNNPPKDESDYGLIDRLRCIGCLSVYEDILQEVKEGE